MRPRRRQQSLVVHELPDELLVYDLRRHRGFCLGKNISWIWRHCSGQRTPGQIAEDLQAELGVPVPADVVGVALHRLSKARLLQDPLVPASPGGSRRDLLKKAAQLGGLSILAISAPTAGQAATCLSAGACVNSRCTDPSGRVCCSGASGCRQNSMACGTGQSGFQCM